MVLVCFLLVTAAVAEEEDDGQYDPAKYEAPFVTLETEEGSVEGRESESPVQPAESLVEAPEQPAESPESPLQPVESPVQSAESPAVSPVQSASIVPVEPPVQRVSEVQPSYPAGVSPLAASTFPNIPSAAPYPLLSPQQSLFPIIPQQISPYVAQQIPPFQPQEIAPFVYSSPQVLRIANEAFPSVAA